MKIAFLGHGRHGKDECCRMLADISGLKNAGTTSNYLYPAVLKYVEEEYEGKGKYIVPTLDVNYVVVAKSREDAESQIIGSGYKVYPLDLSYENRHNHRELWRAAGDWYRKDDPARIVKDALAAGDITGGLRALVEVQAARPLFDLMVWVERPGFPKDPTVEFGPEECDLIIRNDGTLEDLQNKVWALWVLINQFAMCYPATLKMLRGTNV